MGQKQQKGMKRAAKVADRQQKLRAREKVNNLRRLERKAEQADKEEQAKPSEDEE